MQTVSPRPPAAPLGGLDPLTLASTLCARLCHDLAGSLGALTGTLELAAEENDREALDLAIVLAKEVSARLRLLRAAWASGSDVPPPADMLQGLPGAERLRLETAALQAAAPEVLRLSLSLLLVAAAGLPRGGTIVLSGIDQHVSVAIEGPRAAWPNPLPDCLASDGALLAACNSPRSAAIALACLQARAHGRVIALETATKLSVKPL